MERYEKVKEDCVLQFDESMIHKNIHILVKRQIFSSIYITIICRDGQEKILMEMGLCCFGWRKMEPQRHQVLTFLLSKLEG